MNPQHHNQSELDRSFPQISTVRTEPQSSSSQSPRVPVTPVTGAQRKIAIAVDLSDESAYAVRWAVQNYLRPGDAVILLHVRPTSVLYGADWGSIKVNLPQNDAAKEDEETLENQQKKLEDDFSNFTISKANNLAEPLIEAEIPYKIHIVKDHDMKERLCLEVERLGLSAVIMGSRGFGATRRGNMGKLGSVSDYCVHHCVCPVVVVRCPEEEHGSPVVTKGVGVGIGEGVELHPVPEEEHEGREGLDEPKGHICEGTESSVGRIENYCRSSLS